MEKINIFVNNKKFEAELNDTQTAQKIYQILPFKAEAGFWGEEIYFELPLKMENENPIEELEIGDLAYWPPGKAFCIFYGKTPASTGKAPKPASPVTLVGKIKGNVEKLKNLERARIEITK